MAPAMPSRRAGISVRALIVVLALVAAVPLVAWLLAAEVDWSGDETGPMMHVVKRGNFVHEITERGNVESASNVEIRCEVQSRGQAGTTILWIIPEGTYVQPGDELVKLDSSALENELAQQQIVCNNSEAALEKARNDLTTAEIALKEYLEGAYTVAQDQIKMKQFVASEAKRQAEQTLEYSKGLARKGYVTELRVETDKIAVEKADLDYKSAKLELDVLDKYTKEKMLLQFDSDIKTAKANLKSQEASHKVDLDQLALVQKQVANCTIAAPESGQVVYANESDRHGGNVIIIEEGTTVREHQVIIRLPDPKRMQVRAKINEARITLVRSGMPATIRMFTDMVLEGEVEKVNEYPVPAGFWGSTVKEYETFIKILGSPENLKPGLTAEVRILIERIPSVLQVPVQAVFEHGGLHYCVLRDGDGWRAQNVEIGATNDKTVVIRNGVDEGQEVVLGAFAYRDKVNLPKLKEDAKKDRARDRRPAENDAKSERGASPSDSPTKKKDRPRDAADAGFSQMDANKNGKIEKEELPERLRSFFPAIDTDKDGSLSRDELAAAMAKAQSAAPNPPAKNDAGKRP